MAQLANVALSNTFNAWRVRTNDIIKRFNQFAINESMLYANTIIANTNFRALGNTVLGAVGKRTVVNGRTNANGNLTVVQNLFASGNAVIGSAGKRVILNGAVAANGTLNGISNLVASGNVSSNKAVISTQLNVQGNTFLGAVGKTTSITGVLTANGRATIGTNLLAGGNVSSNKVIVTSSITGSTANATFNKVTASSSMTAANATFTGTLDVGSAAIKAQTLNDQASIVWNGANGVVARVTLGGNRTMAAPINLRDGQKYELHIIQDGSGNRTLTWHALYKFPAQTAPTLSTAGGSRDIFSFTSDGSRLFGSIALPDVR